MPPRSLPLSLCLIAAALAGPAYAADLTLPPEVAGQPGAFVPVPATTEGETVRWVVIDPGLNLFPSDLLRDSRTAVVTAPVAGRFRVLAYTAIDGVPSEPAVTTVVIGGAKPVDPVNPVDPDKPQPRPGTFSDLTAKVAEWSRSVPADTRTAAAGVFAAVAGRSFEALKARTEATVADLETAVGTDGLIALRPFLGKLVPELSALQAGGRLTGDDAGKAAWAAVAEGLRR